MRKVEKNGLHYWQFDLLSACKEITHGSFLRHGGVSRGDFASLNVGFEAGDQMEHVIANHAKLEATLQVSLYHTQQKHSDIIHHVTTPLIPPCDALITTKKNIGLLIKHADCQAALLYDPIKKVAASVHAGWRGSVQKIYTKTIQRMQAQFGCSPADLLVCISPSLGPESAEFIHYQKELPEAFWEFQVKPTYFDFWAISEDELRQAGVLAHHIEIARRDTYAHPEDYFSYRYQKRTGRLATIIGLV